MSEKRKGLLDSVNAGMLAINKEEERVSFARRFALDVDMLLWDYGNPVGLIRNGPFSYRAREAGECKTPFVNVSTENGDVSVFVQGIFIQGPRLRFVSTNLTTASMGLVYRNSHREEEMRVQYTADGQLDISNLPDGDIRQGIAVVKQLRLRYEMCLNKNPEGHSVGYS